jgi:hypothetical protein
MPPPQRTLAGEQPPAERVRDLLVEPVALRVALARAGQRGLDTVGMEHAVQVESHAGGTDHQAHDISVLAHHPLGEHAPTTQLEAGARSPVPSGTCNSASAS